MYIWKPKNSCIFEHNLNGYLTNICTVEHINIVVNDVENCG